MCTAGTDIAGLMLEIGDLPPIWATVPYRYERNVEPESVECRDRRFRLTD
jgi:hypothetical protein